MNETRCPEASENGGEILRRSVASATPGTAAVLVAICPLEVDAERAIPSDCLTERAKWQSA